jgi:hypothetical protein
MFNTIRLVFIIALMLMSTYGALLSGHGELALVGIGVMFLFYRMMRMDADADA